MTFFFFFWLNKYFYKQILNINIFVPGEYEKYLVKTCLHQETRVPVVCWLRFAFQVSLFVLGHSLYHFVPCVQKSCFIYRSRIQSLTTVSSCCFPPHTLKICCL